MGRFHFVKCDYTLPEPDVQENIFQTKSFTDDFSNDFSHYLITKDGELIHCINNEHIKINKSIYIYTITKDGWWYEFEIQFTHGKVEKVIRVGEVKKSSILKGGSVI